MITKYQVDPILFANWGWPDVHFFKEQRDVLQACVDSDEVYVVAGNATGKDFIGGFLLIWFFLTRTPVRIITTSAKEDHLRVLWGEAGWWIDNCKYPLDIKRGGPLLINHMELRKKLPGGQLCRISYARGMVASDDTMAAMGGHHAAPKVFDGIPHTLFMADEASSVPDKYYPIISPWAHRKFIFGNAWDCSNFYRRSVDAGDLKAPDGHFYRKVFRLPVNVSPNIRLAETEIEYGKEPSGEIIIPGVKDWNTYQRELATFDEYQKSVSHKAEFYTGKELKLFPQAWMDRANGFDFSLDALAGGPLNEEQRNKLKQQIEAIRIRNTKETRAKRRARAIGCDPGEGSADTSLAAVDELGLIELVSVKTPDTSQIEGLLGEFGRKHGVDPENWVLDRGGGGKQIADRMRAKGLPVRTVAFGESIALEPRRGSNQLAVRKDTVEARYAYVNRRAQMYGESALLLDPGLNPIGYGIPGEYKELRRQLLPIPKLYYEGRLMMIPKNAKPGQDGKVNEKQLTMVKLIGRSPDDADGWVLANYGMLHKPKKSLAGAVA